MSTGQAIEMKRKRRSQTHVTAVRRNFLYWFLLLLIGNGSVPSAASGRPNPAPQIAQDAAQLMPDSFRGFLPKYSSNLVIGTNRFSSQPYLDSQGRELLEQMILAKLEGIVKVLHGAKPKFSLVMEELGLLAEMILLLNLPDLEEPAQENLLSLKSGLENNSHSFRRVVYDSTELGHGSDSVKELVQEIRSRRVLITRWYKDFFFNKSPLDLTIPLDPKSPPFGVLSLVYSHTVNDLARLWLWIWREANGDMAGSPLLTGSSQN
jgi:hypothetical protein